MEDKHITWIKDGYGGINRGPQEFEGIQNSNPIGETCSIIIQRYGTFVVQLKVTKGCLRSCKDLLDIPCLTRGMMVAMTASWMKLPSVVAIKPLS